MATKLIKLQEGLLIEVQIAEGQAEQVAGGHAERVAASFEQIQSVLDVVCTSLAENWEKLNTPTTVEKATVELGLGFEGEGNVFVTKAKANANLTVTLELKPKISTDGE